LQVSHHEDGDFQGSQPSVATLTSMRDDRRD
jgi:hypothetical protein